MSAIPTLQSTPIVVLASGRGSNFDAIQEAIRQGRLSAEIRAVISDQPEAPVLSRAQELGIPVRLVPVGPAQPGVSLADRRKAHEQRLMEALSAFSPRFLVMAGYMRIVSPYLLSQFGTGRGYSRIVNIHPSLLPAFPGMGSYAQAFHYGVKITGTTVHLLGEEDADVDSGPICAQESFSIEDCESVDAVENRGLKVEHRLYPETLSWVLPEKFDIVARSPHIRDRETARRFCVRPH